MRPIHPRPRIVPLLLFLLLAACSEADPGPPAAGDLVLVHASDPHLLDYKRPDQSTLNDEAWRGMFSRVAAGAAGPTPRYLAITGDFGLEGTDPHLAPAPAGTGGQGGVGTTGTAPQGGGSAAALDAAQDDEAEEAQPPTPPAAAPSPAPTGSATGGAASGTGSAARAPTRADTLHADNLRRALAARVARAIRGSGFDSVFFVPGNNDVFLENAEPSAWGEVDRFVRDVQDSLSGKQFFDLTACYRAAAFDPQRCPVQIDSPYVLVGFPSLSLKNAGVTLDEFTRYMNGTAASYDSAMRARADSQDRVHQRLMDQFAQAVEAAANGGRRRVIVLTHIPDLDDPHSVGQRRANLPLKSFPRVGSNVLDAWNASEPVFERWRTVVDGSQVAGVLAGHFHDSHREVYYRPYPWSNAVGRSDRWRTFVTPPLSVKMQDASPIQARGFSVLVLEGDTLRRSVEWYDPRERVFTRDSVGERPAAGRRRPARFDPVQSDRHVAVFALVLLSAWLVFALWSPAARRETNATRVDSKGLTSLIFRIRHRLRPAEGALAALPPAALLLIVVLGIAQAGFGLPRWIWLFAGFWFVAINLLLVLAFGWIRPMLEERRHRADP